MTVTKVTEEPMGRYLLRRAGGIYYFRRPIPAKLRPYFGGCGQWMRTLGTSDPALARMLRDDESVRTNLLILEATQKLAHGILPEPGVSPPKPVVPPEELERRRKAWEQYQQDEVEQAWADGLRENAEEDDPIRQRIAEAVENTRLRIREEQRSAREEMAKERIAARVPIMALFDAYVQERQPGPSTVLGWRSHIRNLIAYLGHEDARRVTRANMIGWKDALSAAGDSGKPRSANTINNSYLAAAAAVFSWGLRNDRVSLNPAAGVKMAAPKQVKLRERSFTEAEAITILAASLQPPKGKLTPEHILARRWVPWICAYTGARVNEITQLRGQDIIKHGGVWTILITPDAGTTKNYEARPYRHSGFPNRLKADS